MKSCAVRVPGPPRAYEIVPRVLLCFTGSSAMRALATPRSPRIAREPELRDEILHDAKEARVVVIVVRYERVEPVDAVRRPGLSRHDVDAAAARLERARRSCRAPRRPDRGARTAREAVRHDASDDRRPRSASAPASASIDVASRASIVVRPRASACRRLRCTGGQRVGHAFALVRVDARQQPNEVRVLDQRSLALDRLLAPCASTNLRPIELLLVGDARRGIRHRGTLRAVPVMPIFTTKLFAAQRLLPRSSPSSRACGAKPARSSRYSTEHCAHKPVAGQLGRSRRGHDDRRGASHVVSPRFAAA